jgi:molybdopterin synthase sulfur carrier subunit
MKLLYFAWVREKLGRQEEELTPPQEVRTVADLLKWLRGLDAAHAAALADENVLRVAVDQRHADFDTPIAGAREVAFFPPVTGG